MITRGSRLPFQKSLAYRKDDIILRGRAVVARQPHKLKVVCSNPTPATTQPGKVKRKTDSKFKKNIRIIIRHV